MSDLTFTPDPDIVRRRRAEVELSIQATLNRVDDALRIALEAANAGLELHGTIADLTDARTSLESARDSFRVARADGVPPPERTTT